MLISKWSHVLYRATIQFVVYGVVLGDSYGVRDAGFTLRLFTHTGVLVSVQCNCQKLPENSMKIVSMTLQHYVSASSESLPVASLYPYGKSQMLPM